MKKLLLLITCILLIIPNIILADEDVYYDNGTGISYDASTSTLTLDNYINTGDNLKDNEFAIYLMKDVTINLIGDSTITAPKGIYSDSNISITGDGTLTIIGTETAYFGSQIGSRAYIRDNSGNMAYYIETEDETLGYYSLYEDMNTYNPIKTLLISSTTYADMNNLVTTTPLYKNSNTYTNNEGLVISGISKNESVTYDPNTLTYFVNIWNDFDDNDYSANFIEFVFNKTEWAKAIDYKVLEANNFYEEKDESTKIVASDNLLSMSVVGSDVYSYTNSNNVDAVSNYFMFVAKGKENSIKLQVFGKNNEYRYINVKVNEKEKEIPTPEQIIYYEIPDTGVRQ